MPIGGDVVCLLLWARATRRVPMIQVDMTNIIDRVMGFLGSTFYIHGHAFGLANSSKFAPVAISLCADNQTTSIPHLKYYI
jgi:EamA domain-containing membrane protein RarD